MSLFPKFRIPGHPPAIFATRGAKSSENSENSNRATQIPNFEVTNDEEDDPILTPGQWYREFHRFHVQVVQETPDLDWKWLREQRPELFQAIRDKEDELDRLGDARLSEVMAIIGEWRELVLQACFEQSELQRMEANKPQPEQGDLKLRAG